MAAEVFEYRGPDGGFIQVARSGGGVAVFQTLAGSQGRGPAVLSPLDAEQLAAAILAAAKPAAEPAPQGSEQAPQA